MTPRDDKAGRDQARGRFRHLRTHCTQCGSTSNVHIHHRDHNPTNNAPENIDYLCAFCHMRLHKGGPARQ